MIRTLSARAVALLLILAAIPVAAGEEALSIPFEKYTLPNGLDVILHVDRSVPIVAVNIWYHVGSKNEKPGRTGFAHLFEHMMFQGSPHFDGEYFTPIQEAGGTVNGSTNEDRTNYWENLPSNYLELALAMESDRMGNLPDAMTQEKLDTQIDVVKNERRERYDNAPYGHADEILIGLLFPKGHPYSWSVIGSMDDLSAATLEDVTEFFRTYYTPNNASLCIAGDFDVDEAKGMVERYFGTVPPGPPVERVTAWSPRLDGVRRARAEDDVELPRLVVAWHSPPFFAPGDAEMDILSFILGDGITSRLERALVYERQIAQAVNVFQDSRELGSIFQIEVTARDGVPMDEIEAALDGELDRLRDRGVTREEIGRARANLETNLVRSLQSVGGFRGRAERLNRYNTVLGDPDRLQWDTDRYRNATAESVSRVAREVLDEERRAILRIVPEIDLAVVEVKVDRGRAPVPVPAPGFDPPEIRREVLGNGMELLLVEDHRFPLVDMQLVLKRGWASDPADRFGAGAITLDMIDQGTKSMGALEIADAFRLIGADFRTAGSFDASSIQLNVLRKHFDEALDVLAELVMEPTFPEEELERKRKEYLGRIRQERTRPMTAGLKTFMSTIYGEGHPYSQPYTGSGTEETVAAVTRDDLVAFHGAHWHPNLTTAVIAGDITSAEAKGLLESAFAKWRRGESPEPVVAAPPKGKTRILIVDKPGAPQSVVVAGNLAIERTSPEYDAFRVVQMALGGQFTSRLNMNLREDKGYTYGSYAFVWGAKNAAPLVAYAQVQSEFTKESVREIVKELADIAGRRPVDEEELAFVKGSMLRGIPEEFETLGDISRALHGIAKYGLPLDAWEREVGTIEGITPDEAARLGGKYVKPDELLIVVVGDRAAIEEGLRELALGEVVVQPPPAKKATRTEEPGKGRKAGAVR